MVPYKKFVSNNVTFHPVCGSRFVRKEWIEALAMEFASAFLVMDFRKMASSQVSDDIDPYTAWIVIYLSMYLYKDESLFVCLSVCSLYIWSL